MLTKPFMEAMPIIERLTSAGYDTYYVGGCVRDTLLNKKIKDIDIATAAAPSIVISLFEKVIPVGLEHGTVIVRLNHESYEVTTFRQDGVYSDQRHPDEVHFVQNVEEDLKRRDFTINALAMTMQGEIIDLFQGENDLKQKLIRTVGSPHNRFMEDPLRIIRALRFSSELGFEIEKATYDEMNILAKEIASLAVERLTNEFTRFFQGKYIKQSYIYFLETDISMFLPVFKDNPHLISKAPVIQTPFMSFAGVIVLYHLYDKTISLSFWIKQWKCSNTTKREALNLSEAINYYHEKGLDNWLVYFLEAAYDEQFVHLNQLISNANEVTIEDITSLRGKLQIKTREDIVINGHDLLALFPSEKAGPWMTELFNQVEKHIVMGNLANKKNDIKEWILCRPPEIN